MSVCIACCQLHCAEFEYHLTCYFIAVHGSVCNTLPISSYCGDQHELASRPIIGMNNRTEKGGRRRPVTPDVVVVFLFVRR